MKPSDTPEIIGTKVDENGVVSHPAEEARAARLIELQVQAFKQRASADYHSAQAQNCMNEWNRLLGEILMLEGQK